MIGKFENLYARSLRPEHLPVTIASGLRVKRPHPHETCRDNHAPQYWDQLRPRSGHANTPFSLARTRFRSSARCYRAAVGPIAFKMTFGWNSQVEAQSSVLLSGTTTPASQATTASRPPRCATRITLDSRPTWEPHDYVPHWHSLKREAFRHPPPLAYAAQGYMRHHANWWPV